MKKIEVRPIDPDRLEKIEEQSHRHRGVWEIDLFHFPEPIKEKERPYFPLVLLSVDRDTGLILGAHLAKPTEHASSLVDQFLDFLEDTQLPLPEKILVSGEKTLKLLEPIARRLEIKLKNVERLPELEAAQYGLLSSEMREKYEERKLS